MKKMIKLLLKTLVVIFCNAIYAQNQGLTNNPSSLPDDLSELVSPESTDGWVYLKDTMYVHPDSLFTKYKLYWGLSNYDSIVKTEVMTDEIGGQHYTFKQYHKGLEVYPMVVRVHDYIGKGLVINGNFVAGLRIETAGIKTPTEIIAAAKNEINATLYTWEDSASEANLKQATGNSNATYYPSPKLLIFQKNIGTDNHYEDGFSLAYRTSIASLLPHKDEVSVFSNASNGNTIYIDAQKCYDKNPIHLPHYSKTDSINVINDIQTKTLLTYVGNPVFHVSNVNSDLHLIDTASPINICALNLNSSHANETFISPTYDSTIPIAKRYAASAIWSTENYEKMMLQYFGNSYLNEVNNHHYFSGAYISGFVYLIDTNGTDSTTGYRAGINGQFFNIGSKVLNGSKIMNSSLDIIGHELTHAITFFKRNLLLIQEPGALGESYSDIFSFALQEYMIPKTGLSRNWLFGNLYESGGYRDMKNPPAKGHPDYYYGSNYIPTICCKPNAFNDACGVHVNAGVQNKWFYLLTQGDTLTRKNVFYKITPIGLDTLLNIVYKSMTEYLIPDMLFIDSRRASIDIAKNLYPIYIANNIAKAWDAVGVIDTFTTSKVIEIGPFTDSTQISWHKDSTITKSLIIHDKAVVTIENDTINMPRNSKIIVKHGGKLIIRNSLIRGFYSCQNSKWDGIEVESGTNGTNYVENSKGNSLLEISNSTISFAKCGIRSGKKSDILNFNDHGGLISIFKTEFRGCDTSIIFYNDANNSNFLNIDSCFFNGQEPGNNDPKQANDHHILIYSAVNLNAHIDTLTAPIDPVFSIKITRSRFENCFNSYIHSYEKCNFGEVPTYQVECLIIKGIEISESYFLMNKKENFIHLSNINNLQIRKSYFTFACETSTPLYIKNWKKNEQDIFILDSNIMENAKWNPNEVILMLGLKTILIRGNLFNCNITNPLFSEFNYMSIKYCDFVLSESNKYILQPNVNGIVDNSYLGPYVWPPAPINSMFTSRLDTFLNGKTALTIGYLYAVGIYNNQIKNFQNGLISRNINHCFINGNLFSNNIYSINAYDNNITNDFLIEQNIFDSSFRSSIHAVNLSNLEIFNNTFNVKSRNFISGDPDVNIKSIETQACKAVDIRDNTFNKANYLSPNSCSGSEYWSHAYFIKNSMGSPHYFVRNNISNHWHYGVFSEGANTNFSMRCNAFSVNQPSCNASIWLHGGLIRDQGKPNGVNNPCINHALPAANVFLFNPDSVSGCSSPLANLGKMFYFDTARAFLTPADTFEYWTQSIDQNNQEFPRLHCKTNWLIKYKECEPQTNGHQIQNSTCDVDNLYQFKKSTNNNNQTWISINGCNEDTILKSKRIQLWDELDAMNNWTIDSTTDIHLLSYMKSHYLNLEEANAAAIAYYTPCDSINRIKEILSATPLINARIGLIDILFNEGELTQAMDLVDQLNVHPLEDKIFPNASAQRNLDIGGLQSVYQIANHYWSQPDSTRVLTTGNINSLETIRSLENYASAKAEALLSIAQDTFYYHPFYYTPPNIAEDNNTQGSQGGPNNQLHQINISPNPFQDQFNLDFIINREFTAGTIEVYSLLNQQSPVYSGNFDNSNVNSSNTSNNENIYTGSVTIQNYSIPGLYFLIVKLDNVVYRMKILIREI